jgi:hypothetical protein
MIVVSDVFQGYSPTPTGPAQACAAAAGDYCDSQAGNENSACEWQVIPRQLLSWIHQVVWPTDFELYFLSFSPAPFPPKLSDLSDCLRFSAADTVYSAVKYVGGSQICWSAIICPVNNCGNLIPCVSDAECVAANPQTPYCVYYDGGCNGKMPY